MKQHTLFLILSVLILSCGSEKNKVGYNADGLLVLTFDDQSSSTFFSDRIFGKVEMIPLETTDDCLVGREPDLLSSDDRHFFIWDHQQQFIMRFDRTGKYINRIGSRGVGPGEYSSMGDCFIDTFANTVDILAHRGQILRYDYDGTFISSRTYGNNPLSFVKTGTDYWFYIGVIPEAGEGRLIKISEDGTVVEKFLPVKTTWPIPFGIVKNFTRCGNIITLNEYISHAVYRITKDGPMQTTVLNFGKYAIPHTVFEGDFETVTDKLSEKGCALIFKYLENERFVYVHFQTLQGEDFNGFYYWLVNKKTGNSVLQKFSQDDPLYKMMAEAQILTADDQLVFMVNAQMLKACTDLFFNHAVGVVRGSLSEDANPVIKTLKINEF